MSKLPVKALISSDIDFERDCEELVDWGYKLLSASHLVVNGAFRWVAVFALPEALPIGGIEECMALIATSIGSGS